MTILGGQFAMLLLVQGEFDQAALDSALAPVAEELGLLLEVRPAGESASGEVRDDYVIAAYGRDRPGLEPVGAGPPPRDRSTADDRCRNGPCRLGPVYCAGPGRRPVV